MKISTGDQIHVQQINLELRYHNQEHSGIILFFLDQPFCTILYVNLVQRRPKSIARLRHNFTSYISFVFQETTKKNMACFWSRLMIAVKTCYQILIKFSRIFWLGLYSWHIWSLPPPLPRQAREEMGTSFPCCFYCIIVLMDHPVRLQFEVSFDQLGRYLQCTDDHDHNSITTVTWQMYSYERFDGVRDGLKLRGVRHKNPQGDDRRLRSWAITSWFTWDNRPQGHNIALAGPPS